jgi:tetratricopeptide (TPR) repeat protein
LIQKQSKSQSKVFRDFKTLDKRNYHSVVRFYEKYRMAILALPFDEAFVMKLTYCTALFEVGRYEQHLEVADEIIESSILNNIQFYQGEDIYLKTLFQKAKAQFELKNYEASKHILKELLKLSPRQKTYPKLLHRCYLKRSGQYLQNLQSIGIFILLISAGFLVINVLVFHNFYPKQVFITDIITSTGFGFGVLLILSSILIQRVRIRGKVITLQKEALERKLKMPL